MSKKKVPSLTKRKLYDEIQELLAEARSGKTVCETRHKRLVGLIAILANIVQALDTNNGNIGLAISLRNAAQHSTLSAPGGPEKLGRLVRQAEQALKQFWDS